MNFCRHLFSGNEWNTCALFFVLSYLGALIVGFSWMIGDEMRNVQSVVLTIQEILHCSNQSECYAPGFQPGCDTDPIHANISYSFQGLPYTQFVHFPSNYCTNDPCCRRRRLGVKPVKPILYARVEHVQPQNVINVGTSTDWHSPYRSVFSTMVALIVISMVFLAVFCRIEYNYWRRN